MSVSLSNVKRHQMAALICTVILLVAFGKTWSQKKVRFALADGTEPITEWPYQMLSQGRDTISIRVVRFYIHGIQCTNKGREVWSSSATHYLFDSDKGLELDIPLDSSLPFEMDAISFVIGVDSALQMSGAQSGSLDPMHGMYWTWQSGYIHWKLETSVGEDASIKPLTWHVGGYQAPFNSLRVCRFSELPNTNDNQFTLDLHRLISEANTDVPASIMSPSAHALRLSDIVQSCMQWQP